MIATYRLQLDPGFGFDDARALLPYLRRLGVSHLYLSPITEARRGSVHGYDVTDHNSIREELGGAEAFRRLREAARAEGLGLILDFVPNHAGVGARNDRWQDVLAYGPYSPYAHFFDIDWEPLKPELRNRILLPYLDRPYGECLDRGEITVVYERDWFAAAHQRNRFALAPRTCGPILESLARGRGSPAAALAELAEECRTLYPGDRDRAEALRLRLARLLAGEVPAAALEAVRGPRLHALLEEQCWRLAFWRTAAHEVNYRRFFDINELVALRMEDPEVFAETHRLLGALLAEEGVAGVRIDHIDGLFDPHGYLAQLRGLGARHIWVEKILARGETLPDAWPVEGTSGYEFLNDVLALLAWPAGAQPLDRIYRRFVREALPYREEVHRSKRLVMETTLSGELSRLALGLDRLSEADYHTRDFTREALRAALAEVLAAVTRYRTYLPHDRDEARQVIHAAVQEARRRNPGTEPTVYAFIGRVLLEDVAGEVEDARRAWVGRFQQYTAPLAAKGVEDTAFYRYLRLVALNEVGGEPERLGLSAPAFHARCRSRAARYPRSLLATATHDHKRGEDTRARLIALAEFPEAWSRTLGLLSRIARRHRSPPGPSRADEFLFAQTLLALWVGTDRAQLPDRLAAYMRKAAREAKQRTSWVNPDEEYEAALERFVRGMLADPRLEGAVTPLAQALARHGFANGLTQLVLKLTAPGVPDIYRGAELLDLSLVDPDNRAPVDFASRMALLEDLEPLLARPDPDRLRGLVAEGDDRLKLFVLVRLLRFRRAHAALFGAPYRPLEAEGPAAEHLVAFAREAGAERLVTVVPRFPAMLERHGRWGTTAVPLPEEWAGRTWTEILTGTAAGAEGAFSPDRLPLPWAVLFSAGGSPAAPARPEAAGPAGSPGAAPPAGGHRRRPK